MIRDPRILPHGVYVDKQGAGGGGEHGYTSLSLLISDTGCKRKDVLRPHGLTSKLPKLIKRYMIAFQLDPRCGAGPDALIAPAMFFVFLFVGLCLSPRVGIFRGGGAQGSKQAKRVLP